MQEPFRIEVSTNVQKFVFAEKWNYLRDYQAVFNSLDDVLANHMPKDTPWGMVGDWRKWLVQTPESERVCVRSLSDLCGAGMSHYVSVAEEHPITLWQHDRLQGANPALVTAMCTNFADAESWLASHGFDTNFRPIPFNPHWLAPSERFNNALRRLKLDPHKFTSV